MYQWPCVVCMMKIQTVNWCNKNIINYHGFNVGHTWEGRPLFQGSEIFLQGSWEQFSNTIVCVLSDFRNKINDFLCCHHTLDGRRRTSLLYHWNVSFKENFSYWILRRVSWLVVENILPALFFRSWLWIEENRWSYWLHGSNTGLSESHISRHCYKTALMMRHAT